MQYIYFFSFQIIFNIIFLLNFSRISNLINLFDFPDKERKIHKKPVPLLGGIFLTINFIFFVIFELFFNSVENNIIGTIYLSEIKQLFIFFVVFFALLFLGILDDRYNLKPYLKLTLITIIFYLVVAIDDQLPISELRFDTLNLNIPIVSNSILFTTLCFLVFLNALNMFDGINGQSSIYLISLFLLFIFKTPFFYLSILIIIFLIFFSILNLRGKCFLGDSGIFVLSFLVSYIFIKTYNLEQTFCVEDILVYMLFPGLDLVRLFITRSMNGRNPFVGDRNHIHHLLYDKFGFNKSIIFIFVLITIPFLMNNFLFENQQFTMSLIVAGYLFIYLISKKKHN